MTMNILEINAINLGIWCNSQPSKGIVWVLKKYLIYLFWKIILYMTDIRVRKNVGVFSSPFFPGRDKKLK